MRSMDINGDDGEDMRIDVDITKVPEGYAIVSLDDEDAYFDDLRAILVLAHRAGTDKEERSCLRLIKRAIKMIDCRD